MFRLHIITKYGSTTVLSGMTKVLQHYNLTRAAYLSSSRHLGLYISDDKIQTFSVAGGVAVKLDVAVSRPAVWGTIIRDNGRGLDISKLCTMNSKLVTYQHCCICEMLHRSYIAPSPLIDLKHCESCPVLPSVPFP